jgi:hypothetical protein
MTSVKYLVVERWEEFQHYKNRAPLWIKNYTRLLHDDTYLGLTGHQRAVLHGIWLVYASSACRLLFDAPSIGKRLSLRVTSADLKALKKAGFITTSASKPLAVVYRDASPEKEREKEKESKAVTVEVDVANGPGLRKIETNGVVAFTYAKDAA